MPANQSFTDAKKPVLPTKSFVAKEEAKKTAQKPQVAAPEFDLSDEQKDMIVDNVLKRLTDDKIQGMRQAITDLASGNNGFTTPQSSKIKNTMVRLMSDMYNPGEHQDLNRNAEVSKKAVNLTAAFSKLLTANLTNPKFREAAKKDHNFVEAIISTYTAVEKAITSGQNKGVGR